MYCKILFYMAPLIPNKRIILKACLKIYPVYQNATGYIRGQADEASFFLSRLQL